MNNLKKTLQQTLWTWFCIVFGNALFAFLVAAFVIPHDILMGGVTGIGIVLSKVFPIETAVFVLVLNVLLLFWGLIVLGRKFFVTTVASTLLYPVFLGLFQRIPGIETLTDNALLAAIYAGLLLGLSLGMVMRVGSSTGGIDIVTLIFHKWFHLPVAVFIYIMDIVVVGGQALFATTEQTLLGILVIVLETLVLDQVMIFGKAQIQIFAISEKYEALRTRLLRDLGVGVTMAIIETGVGGETQKAVLCVLHSRKLYDATELIRSVDPEAFVTVTKIKEVQGRGFTQERRAVALERLGKEE